MLLKKVFNTANHSKKHQFQKIFQKHPQAV